MPRSWAMAGLSVLVAATVLGGTAHGAIVAQYAFTGATLNRSATTVANDAPGVAVPM